MQDQQKFLEIITNPYQLDKNTLTFLQKTVEEYPYCQSIQVLLAKNIQEYDKLEFEKQVNKASAYSINRRKFQRYISGKDQAKSVKIAEDQILSQVALQKEKPKTATKEKSDKQSLLEIVRKRLRDIGERKQTGYTEPKQNETTGKSAFIDQKKEPVLTDISHTASDENEKTNHLNQLSFEIDIDQLHQIKPLRSFAPERYRAYQINIAEEDTQEQPKQESIEEDTRESPQNITEQEKDEETVISEEKTPDVAIKNKEKTEIPKVKEAEETHAKLPEAVTKEKDKTETTNTSFERVKGLPGRKPSISELIDKFLKEDPRIKVDKDLPEEQEDLSSRSTSEDPQIATETLANVYLKQGNKEKALDIYEKLCLKFPQKSSYFAKKIIEIKNELNT